MRLVALMLAAMVLLGSQGEWAFLKGPFGPTSPGTQGTGSLRAQAAATNTIFMPFLAKNYAQGPSVLGIDMGDPTDDTKARLVAEASAKWIRVTLVWSAIEPSNTTPENFIWTEYDLMFARVAQFGLSPIVVVTGNPSWAADTTCGPINRTSLQEFGQFLSAIVSRYGQAPYGFKYWELYNEPDNTDVNRAWLGGCWGGKGKEYGDMLKTAYPAIKAADPNAEVMLGSLAYDWFTTDAAKGPFEERFLDDVIDPLKGNARAYFDLVGFHYYPAFRTRWETFGTDVMGKAKYLRDKLGNYGVVKSMAVTEINMWSGAAHGGSEELQSDYVVQAYSRGMAADLVFLIWFNLVDYNDWEYGLLKQDLSRKQAYTAYKVMANMLNGYSYSGLFRYTGTKPVDVEGYTFTLPNGKERHTVWATVNDTRWVSFAGSKAVVTSKLGIAFELTDAEDGIPDGKVTFSVTQRPVYVDITP